MKKTTAHHTKMRGWMTAAALACIGAVPTVIAQPIYTANFEPTTYLADIPLVGQDGWIAPPPLSPTAAMVTRDRPRIGHQTVHVLGADLEHQDFITEATSGYFDAIGSYRRAVNYDTGNAQTVRLSALVRVDGPRTTSGNNFFSAAIAGRAESTFNGDPSSASVGEMALSSDGHVYAYSGNDLVPTFLASRRVSLGEWHQLMIVADFSTRTSSFYLDDAPLTTVTWDPGEVYTGVLLRGALLAYTAPDTMSNRKANYAAHYDQFSIKAAGNGNDSDRND